MMTDIKDDNKKTGIPYEPPRLFNLGASVAYAGGVQTCKDGGSPEATSCAYGSMAVGQNCLEGNYAGTACKGGCNVSGGANLVKKCKTGACVQ